MLLTIDHGRSLGHCEEWQRGEEKRYIFSILGGQKEELHSQAFLCVCLGLPKGRTTSMRLDVYEIYWGKACEGKGGGKKRRWGSLRPTTMQVVRPVGDTGGLGKKRSLKSQCNSRKDSGQWKVLEPKLPLEELPPYIFSHWLGVGPGPNAVTDLRGQFLGGYQSIMLPVAGDLSSY